MKKQWVFSVGLIGVYGLAVFARVPQLFFHPRLWAEEATVYLERGLTLLPLTALWLPDSGYINLLANAVGILAARMPLEYAPIVPLAVSFLIMLLPVVLVLTAENIWQQSVWAQAGAVAVILLAVPNQEVWLNSITSQFYLSLATGIILALPIARSDRMRRLHRAVIILAGVGGAASVLLAPLFCFRAWKDRSRERVVQAAILSSAVVVQLLIAAHYGLGNHVIKFVPGVWWLVFIVKSVLMPFLGGDAVQNLVPFIWQGFIDFNRATLFLIGVSLAAMIGGIVLWLSKISEVRWLAAAALTLIFFSLILSLDAPAKLVSYLAGNRYFFAPNALLGLALAAWVFHPGAGKRWIRAAGAVILIWLALVGAREYVDVDALFFEGPSWRAEIRTWQADPAHMIHVWPRPWTWEVP